MPRKKKETHPMGDLRAEVLERLRDPDTRSLIVDSLIREAQGGAADSKTGEPKGGASALKAFEIIQDMIDRSTGTGTTEAADKIAKMSDEELCALLDKLKEG